MPRDLTVLNDYLDRFLQCGGPASPADSVGHAGLAARKDSGDSLCSGVHIVRRRTWLDATAGNNGSGTRTRAKYKIAYMKRGFTEAEARCIYKHLTRTIPNVDLRGSMIEIDSYGGAINRKELLETTSVAQRASVLKLQFMTFWGDSKEGFSGSATFTKISTLAPTPIQVTKKLLTGAPTTKVATSTTRIAICLLAPTLLRRGRTLSISAVRKTKMRPQQYLSSRHVDTPLRVSLRRTPMMRSHAFNRRHFLRILGTVPLALRTSLAQTRLSTLRFVYIGSGCDQIQVFHIDGPRWMLKQIVPCKAPASLTIDPNRRLLSAVNQVAHRQHVPTGSVETFTIDCDGRLPTFSKASLSLSVCDPPPHLTLSPDGKTAVVAIHGGGAYSLLTSPDNGEPLQIAGILKRLAGGQTCCIKTPLIPTWFSSTRPTRAIASDTGSDRISVFTLNLHRPPEILH